MILSVFIYDVTKSQIFAQKSRKNLAFCFVIFFLDNFPEKSHGFCDFFGEIIIEIVFLETFLRFRQFLHIRHSFPVLLCLFSFAEPKIQGILRDLHKPRLFSSQNEDGQAQVIQIERKSRHHRLFSPVLQYRLFRPFHWWTDWNKR